MPRVNLLITLFYKLPSLQLVMGLPLYLAKILVDQ